MTSAPLLPCPGVRDPLDSTVRPLPMCQECMHWQQADEARRTGAEWLVPGAYISHALQLHCRTRVPAG